MAKKIFKFDNLVGVLFNEDGKAKLEKLVSIELSLGFIFFFITVLMFLSMDTQLFTHFNFIDFLDSFSLTNYVFIPIMVAIVVAFIGGNRFRYNIIKKYGKVIEYSVEMRIEDEGIYVTYLNDNLEIFFRREDLFIDVITESKSICKYLKLKEKRFVELSAGDNEIKIPLSMGNEFYGKVYERYPEVFPDYEDDEDDED